MLMTADPDKIRESLDALRELLGQPRVLRLPLREEEDENGVVFIYDADDALVLFAHRRVIERMRAKLESGEVGVYK